MDKAEAIERLEYLKARAQVVLEQEVPDWIAEDVLGTIEAYDMAIEALQTEPNSSEKPNNCETCRFELYCPEMCEGCCEWDSHYEPKDEPQTYVINPQEPTNDEKCFECDDFFTCGGQCNKIEDEPQAEIPEYAEWKEPFEKMTDCPWK